MTAVQAACGSELGMGKHVDGLAFRMMYDAVEEVVEREFSCGPPPPPVLPRPRADCDRARFGATGVTPLGPTAEEESGT